MNKLLTIILLTLTTITALASGSHDEAMFPVGEPAKARPDRRFDVSLQDSMRFVFSPEFKDLKDGEVIQFYVKNDGAIVHEFSIGNAAEQVAHAKMMREMPNMKHSDPSTVSLEPGQSTSIKWRFKGNDTVVFACNVAGHFEAGMRHDMAIMGSNHSD